MPGTKAISTKHGGQIKVGTFIKVRMWSQDRGEGPTALWRDQKSTWWNALLFQGLLFSAPAVTSWKGVVAHTGSEPPSSAPSDHVTEEN